MSLRALGRFDGHWVTGYPTILKRTWCRVGTTPRPFGFKKTGGNFPLLGDMRGKFMTFPSNKLLLCSVLQLQGLLWRYVLERAQLLRSTAKWNRVGKLRQHFNCISEDHRKNIGLRRSKEGLWRSVTQGSGTRSTQIFYDLLYLHIQNFRKLISQGQAVSVHLLNTWYGIIVGQHLENCPLHMFSVVVFRSFK